MIQHSITRLGYILQKVPALLTRIPENEFSQKSAPAKWSKKEIIGHLIDSAANNHQRFVRGQFEPEPHIQYDQDQWNKAGFYQQIDSRLVIDFWTAYNKQILEIIKRIPADKLQRTIQVEGQLQTLDFLINDYVVHMEHHLKQVLPEY